MTPDDRRRETPPHEQSIQDGSGTRRVGIRVLGAAVSYGLLLTLRSDTFFFFGILGVFGLVVFVTLVIVDGLTKPFGDRSLPYERDGSDPHAAVRFHYQVLLKRYAVLGGLTVLFAAVPALVDSGYVFPFYGLAVVSAVAGVGVFIDQMRWLRQCSRALKVYSFVFRSPVQKLEKRPYGRRFLRVGGVGSHLPKMSARAIVGRGDWPAGIAEGVAFAGDDPFGGVVLVPSTGELMCMQPLDWNALAGERAQAGTERQQNAERAGLHKQSM